MSDAQHIRLIIAWLSFSRVDTALLASMRKALQGQA